jgi:DNA (cytosine-5)-methyltransferase 1
MAESGWLTRSLEQPYPYTLNYNGKINNKTVKNAFLEIINDIEVHQVNPRYIIVELLRKIIKIQAENKIIIQPLKNPEKLTISTIIDMLDAQFSYRYTDFGGSKLPVLAFYAIYQIIVNEVSRYHNCQLKELGSHTASDRTSKSAGDIELFKDTLLFEAIEIKLDKIIDANILRIAEEKIIKYNPQRYYILSYYPIKIEDIEQINEIIKNVKEKHGCQIVINGVLPTLQYYLRLISSLEVFVNHYSKLIQQDTELKSCHKEKWNHLLVELQNVL